jgi:hypothetical protein
MDGTGLKGHTILGTSGGAFGQRTDSIGLPDAATNGVSCVVQIPMDSTSQAIKVRPVWAPSSSSSGAIRWSLKVQNIINSDITASPTAVNFTGVNNSFTVNSPVLEDGVLSNTAINAGGLVRIGIYRLGGDALDTYAGIANLLGLQIDYSANK